MAPEKLRFWDLAMFALPVYVLLILAIGFVFTVANDLTKQEGRLSYYSEIFFMLLYLSATVSFLVLEVYVIRNARKHHQTLPHYGIDNNAVVTNDIEMHSVSDKPEVTGYMPQIGLSTQKGANLYFLLGGMGFGLGTILSDLFSISDYVRFKEHSCLHPFEVVVFLIHAVFVGNQMVFIWRHHTTVIVSDRFLTRFLLLHILAVNICVCINTAVSDAAEEFRHETEARKQKQLLLEQNSTSESCYKERELRTLSAPFLTPCTIEHSLFALPVLYLMYTTTYTAKLESGDTEVVQPNEKVPMERRYKKLWRMVKTIHIGFLIFILAAVAVGLFFMYVDYIGDEEKAQAIFHTTEISLLLLLLASIFLGFFLLHPLGFDHERSGSLDQTLLLVATTGHLIYDITRIVAGIDACMNAEVSNDPTSSVYLSTFAALFSILEVLAQTTFLIFAMRLYAEHDHHIQRKPGRSLIGFLLLGNLAMWMIDTFEFKKTAIVPLFVNYYGYLSWSLISYSLTPLLIFYRFHTTACLSDIWKEAYQKKED